MTSEQQWRKSSYSGGEGGNCVEVGQRAGSVLVRDTKRHGEGPELAVGADAWRAFVAGVRSE